ncbi:glycosyl transferase [Lysobacteraceae bacterium NML75-0749]|nr:glycosyl transferase [Xanthomonadaceae bacterium NML75-0749]PJK05975.1 glycosyl transferase [Xanthomonadaceae bacterium NML91-0268]
MSTDAIAVVVVSYQSASTIEDCLRRLLRAKDVAQIRVIDNGSCDGTLELVQRLALADTRLRFIANPDNPGFAVACNQGAAASSAPWLAFVNPDLMVEPDTLLRLRDAARQLGTALVGADLHDESGVHDAAARRRDPDFVAMLRRPAARQLAIARDAAQPVQPVPAISGALLLLPRSLFAQVGGFDEGYRLHAEDLDLCRRVRAAGATVACVNAVDVLHLRGVSSRSNPLFVEWHKHRGLWRYFCKFDAPRHGLWARAAVFALIGTRFVLTALGKSIKP